MKYFKSHVNASINVLATLQLEYSTGCFLFNILHIEQVQMCDNRMDIET